MTSREPWSEKLLGPLLRDDLNQGNAHLKLASIAAVSEFDPVRALGMLQNGGFQVDNFYAYVQGEVAAKLAEKDPRGPRLSSRRLPIHGRKSTIWLA